MIEITSPTDVVRIACLNLKNEARCPKCGLGTLEVHYLSGVPKKGYCRNNQNCAREIWFDQATQISNQIEVRATIWSIDGVESVSTSSLDDNIERMALLERHGGSVFEEQTFRIFVPALP